MPDLPFNTLRPWLLATHGRPLHRVALDAGSTCPNRDGTRGFGGCFYCDVEGSGTGALKSGADLSAQLERGLKRVARRDPDGGAIAYFQSYTNTYVDLDRLRATLAVVEPHLPRAGVEPRPGEVAVVSLATRPDTLPDEALGVLSELARRVPVWVEIGLECADDDVLLAINRLHTRDEFRDAVARSRAAGLAVVGHAILGLPGDGRGGARRTAELLAETGVEGVKVHQLMVLRRTQFEKQWRDGGLATLDLETYVSWLADFVERLAPEQVLHRLTGDGMTGSDDDVLLAPIWGVHKNEVRAGLVRELERRGTRQGSRCSAGRWDRGPCR